jgi:hypothetical protein
MRTTAGYIISMPGSALAYMYQRWKNAREQSRAESTTGPGCFDPLFSESGYGIQPEDVDTYILTVITPELPRVLTVLEYSTPLKHFREAN